MKKVRDILCKHKWILPLCLIAIDYVIVGISCDEIIRGILWIFIVPVLFGVGAFKGWISKCLVFIYELFLFVATIGRYILFLYEESFTDFTVAIPFPPYWEIPGLPLLLSLCALIVNLIIVKQKKSKMDL